MVYVAVQSDFDAVVRDVVTDSVERDSFWVKVGSMKSYKKAIIAVQKDSGKLIFTSQDADIEFKKLMKNRYQIVVKNTPDKEKTIDLRCVSYHSKPMQREITSFDIIPSSEKDNVTLLALGDVQGKLKFAEINSQSEISDLNVIEEAHFADITKVKFFPSAKVLITVGLDYSAKIWSFPGGENPRTLRKQKGRITDVCIVGKGRNILTSSLDGSIIIWECGTSKDLYEFRRIKALHDGVTVIKLRETDSKPREDETENHINSHLFEAEGKICYSGHKSGTIALWDLYSQTTLGEYSSLDGSPVSALILEDEYIYAGYENSFVRCWSYNDFSAPVWERQMLNSQLTGSENIETIVNDILYLNEEDKLLLSWSDSQLVALNAKNGEGSETYFGFDTSLRINEIKKSGSEVYAAGKGGLFLHL
ncbi:unnamed protein product [[Candida] boidinii]|nr:unnamed protein product [[Candida] boidinii]